MKSVSVFARAALAFAVVSVLSACSTTGEPMAGFASPGFAPADGALAAPMIAAAPRQGDLPESVEVVGYAGSTPDAPAIAAPAVSVNERERECLMRAMYFESHRSSREGLFAVGTVVMNRVADPRYPSTICGVVGQKNQFAPGVLTRKMQGDLTDLRALATQIMAGERHPRINAPVMFFHTAGLSFPYKNMRYVHEAGGNAFYYKASRKRRG